MLMLMFVLFLRPVQTTYILFMNRASENEAKLNSQTISHEHVDSLQFSF